MSGVAVQETARVGFDAAGDLEDEVLEFIRLQDMQATSLATIHTAFSSFPTCCS